MSTQTVNFEGQSYQFPDDAKDDEILSFLNQHHADVAQVNSIGTDRLKSGQTPVSPPPVPKMQKVNLAGGTSANPDPVRPMSSQIGDLAGGMIKSTGHVAVAAPTILQRIAQRHNVLPQGDVFPGQHTAEQVEKVDLPNAAMMTIGGMEGLESSPEAGASAAGLRSSAEGDAAAASSGVESSSRPPAPVQAAAKGLVKEPPVAGTRSNVRDALGLAHGLIKPHSPFAWSDAATSIQSILRKHNAATEPIADPVPEPPTGAGTYGSPVDMWGKMIEKPAPVPRPEPAWKTNPPQGTPVESILEKSAAPVSRRTTFPTEAEPKPTRPAPSWRGKDTSGTPVESVAPHTQGDLTQPDVQSLLEKTGPPRGGKGQVGRAILRKNVKSMAADVQPDTPNLPDEVTMQHAGQGMGDPVRESIIHHYGSDVLRDMDMRVIKSRGTNPGNMNDILNDVLDERGGAAKVKRARSSQRNAEQEQSDASGLVKAGTKSTLSDGSIEEYLPDGRRKITQPNGTTITYGAENESPAARLLKKRKK